MLSDPTQLQCDQQKGTEGFLLILHGADRLPWEGGLGYVIKPRLLALQDLALRPKTQLLITLCSKSCTWRFYVSVMCVRAGQ